MPDAPCKPWIVAADLPCYVDGSPVDDNYAVAADMASRLLYVWTGRKYAGAGACTSTARPGRQARPDHWPLDHRSYGVGAARYGYGSCGCLGSARVRLAGYPIVAVRSVTIDGVDLDPAAYRLERNELVRQDGGFWPSCQNEAAALGAVGTWSVTYTHGGDPPVEGIVAAKTLACELYKGLTTGKCALPAGVTRVVRQGITYEMVSAAFDSSGKVRTGIVLVDQFIGTDNPSGQRRRTAVYSPDRSYARRV